VAEWRKMLGREGGPMRLYWHAMMMQLAQQTGCAAARLAASTLLPPLVLVQSLHQFLEKKPQPGTSPCLHPPHAFSSLDAAIMAGPIK
jgi:hypothetical protein